MEQYDSMTRLRRGKDWGESPVLALAVAVAVTLVLKGPEGQMDVLIDLVKVLLDPGLALLENVLKLHGGQLFQDLPHGVLLGDLPRHLRREERVRLRKYESE